MRSLLMVSAAGIWKSSDAHNADTRDPDAPRELRNHVPAIGLVRPFLEAMGLVVLLFCLFICYGRAILFHDAARR
ncbi:hypothetical protein TSOC_009976 [Tetrabaena socialis]|uniref:Uncharacterized protein n=1 Tax=Tetrabaena socialis TaxID=47790 RepID=A0A2J7ZUG7_9CHLO|nr:hypothetical protein TSOC_009976 [Tetrabaena socialis]|eukprot:PNH03914.1 hypothetical protein TSOC_009976 [Tetrabaena socialis]